MVRVTQNNYAFYLQDNYKVTSRLTLTPGLRWDVNPAFKDRQRAIGAFDVPSHSIVLAEPLEYYYKIGATSPAVVRVYEAVDVKFKSAAEAGRSSQFFQNNYFDIGPRVGFAYRLGDGAREVVIRGGYGLYISPTSLRFQLNPFAGMAPFRARLQYNPNSAAQSPDGIVNYLLRSVPTVVAGVNSANVIDLNNPNASGAASTWWAWGTCPA